ncbi:hypothetical protein MTO96_002144 [Rhipicephalus appendiculatus]
MSLSQSNFSGSLMDYQIPCTSREGRVCDIFSDVFQWNKYLWKFGLGLREHLPGQLSLVVVRFSIDDDYKRKVMRTAATRLHHLLTRHHCVTFVEMRVWMFWRDDPLMYDALSRSLSLSKLKLILEWSYHRDPPVQTFATALLHLNHLKELECDGVDFNFDFIECLSEFLSNTRLLTTLNLSKFRILRRRYAFMAADFLRRNSTLRTLNVSSEGVRSFSLVRPMVQTLLSNRCLTELTITWLTLVDEDVDLINQLLSRNRTLTRFNLIECKWDKAQRQNGTDGEHRSGNSVGVTSRIQPFLVALSKNKTLQELTLTPSWFNTNECRSLFETVSSHASLKKVKLEVCEREDAVEIYRALRETGAQDRFFLGTHRALRENEVALTQSKKPSGVGVDEHVFYGLRPVARHAHPAAVAQPGDFAVASSGAGSVEPPDFGDVVHEARRELVLALSVNESLRRLEVRGSWSEEAGTRLLADTVLSSRTLCHVSFNPDERESAVSLVRMLSPKIAGNYTLLSLRPEDHFPYSDRWFRVNNVTRRNCALVTRAAHFVTGTEEKYCAAAAELVHYNPGLVEKVQELASVDEMKAASLIKASLKKISELDAFMRLAGVVKYGVTCHSRDDGKKQLVDIGRDCWLHLRQFIKLDDILN